jgi:hypothetical protein
MGKNPEKTGKSHGLNRGSRSTWVILEGKQYIHPTYAGNLPGTCGVNFRRPPAYCGVSPRLRLMITFMISLVPAKIERDLTSRKIRQMRYSSMYPYPPWI